MYNEYPRDDVKEIAPLPPFREEREGPAPSLPSPACGGGFGWGWEGEAGGAAHRFIGPLTLPSPPGRRGAGGGRGLEFSARAEKLIIALVPSGSRSRLA